MFSNIFKRFRTFSIVFERFYFAYFAQTLQTEPLTLDFGPKAHTPPKNNPQKPQFFKIPDNFTSQLEVVIEVSGPARIAKSPPFFAPLLSSTQVRGKMLSVSI